MLTGNIPIHKKITRPPLWSILFLCVYLTLSITVHADTPDKQSSVIVLDSPEIVELFESIGKPLVKAAGLTAESVQFHVILNSQINAMALPNGHLVFNSGLLDQCESPEELASVMAHEIAHLSAGHYMRLQREMQSISIQALLASVVGLAAGVASGNSSISQAALVGSSAAAQSVMLDSMREKESQADRLAVHYLANAGYNPGSMASFLNHLLGEQRKASLPAPYLLTHPLSMERVLDAERTAASVTPNTTQKPKTDPIALKRVQAYLIASTETDPKKAETFFQTRLGINPNDLPARYGLALVHRYAGETKKAHGLIDSLLLSLPKDPYLLREKGLLLLDDGKPEIAEQIFSQALTYRPDNPDLRYRLSISLNEGGKLEQAARLLRKLTVEKPTVPIYQYQLGVVEGQRDRLGHAHLAMARHYALLMDEKMAIFHYKEAVSRFPPSEREHEIAQTELKYFQEEHLKSKEINRKSRQR
ncbi:MAG: peptidase M48, Ste24p [Magnetococcales bacterium]|nr:peptidase M48, Ste24p [Magnetococcales bacterium]HIJ84676.1 M48 family metalloprotease [Magnetococcales bacterium]